MNDLIFYIYLVDVLSSFKAIYSAILFLVCSMGGFVLAILSVERGLDAFKPLKTKTFKLIAFVSLLIAFICMFIPSKTTMYTMLALKTVDVASESSLVQKSMKLLEQKIDEELEGENDE